MVEYISKSDICLLCINKHNEIESTEKKVNWVGKKMSACKNPRLCTQLLQKELCTIKTALTLILMVLHKDIK